MLKMNTMIRLTTITIQDKQMAPTPLPGFEENGLDNNDDQHFDNRDQMESNALQNGYREHGMNIFSKFIKHLIWLILIVQQLDLVLFTIEIVDNDSPSSARPTTTKSRPKLQNQNSRKGSGGASRPHTGYGKIRTTDGMTNGSGKIIFTFAALNCSGSNYYHYQH